MVLNAELKKSGNSNDSSTKEAALGSESSDSMFNNNAVYGNKKKRLLIGCLCSALVIIIAVVVLVVLLNNYREANPDSTGTVDETEAMEYSIAPNPETGEPPLFGSDPNKDNSGDAFIEFEKRIIASSDYSTVVKNNARISIAVYYNAINEYNEALKILSEINVEDVFGTQLQQLYEAYANTYNGLGEIERANEYRNLAEQVEL